MPKRRQAIIWTNNNLAHWRIYAALEGDELMFITWKSIWCHGYYPSDRFVRNKILPQAWLSAADSDMFFQIPVNWYVYIYIWEWMRDGKAQYIPKQYLGVLLVEIHRNTDSNYYMPYNGTFSHNIAVIWPFVLACFYLVYICIKDFSPETWNKCIQYN